MKYVLLWLLLGPTGQVTSGAAEFDDLSVCNVAQVSLVNVTYDAAQKRAQHATVGSRCVPQRSSK